MVRLDHVAIIWTIIVVVAATGFVTISDNSSNQKTTNEMLQAKPDTNILSESEISEISRGDVVQQAEIMKQKALMASNNQPPTSSMAIAKIPSIPTITNITTSNLYLEPLRFTPNHQNISALQSMAQTQDDDSYVTAVFYDKNSECFGIISTSTRVSFLQQITAKLYKCDGTFVRDINPPGEDESFSNNPKYWTFDTEGNLFYAYRSQIVKADTNGDSSIFANRFVRGLAIDSMDNVYVADNGYQIHKYGKNGNFISTLNIFPEHDVAYYVQLSDSFDEGYVGVKANHWFGILDRFPGYHNSIEYDRPNVDCDPDASIKSNDRPTVKTRGDYDVLTDGELRADQPTNYGVDGNIFGPDPCAIVIFVHGYNNDHNDALQKYDNVYDKLWNLGEYDLAKNLIVYSWDSDTGWAFLSENYHRAQNIGISNGHALAAFISAYKNAHPTTKIFLMSHSMGAQVVLSALDLGARVDRLDMLGPAAEAYVLEDSNQGNYLDSRVTGGVYVHINTSDDALESAKNTGVVRNPLGLEGAPKTCNPSHFGTRNINSIAIDSKDRLYVVLGGSYVHQLDINTGNLMTPAEVAHVADPCILINGNYVPSFSTLTTRGEALFIGNSISPHTGIYYDRTPPVIPDPRNYVVTSDPQEFIPPQAIDYDPAMNPTSIKETSCSTSTSTGKIIRTCVYADTSGNKVVYQFEVKKNQPEIAKSSVQLKSGIAQVIKK